MRRVLWWLLGGTRGGRNRLRVISALSDTPMNAHQLSKALELDYKTVQHHLDLLVENDVLTTMGDRYGKTYFLTDQMEANLDVLREVAKKADLTDVEIPTPAGVDGGADGGLDSGVDGTADAVDTEEGSES